MPLQNRKMANPQNEGMKTAATLHIKAKIKLIVSTDFLPLVSDKYPQMQQVPVIPIKFVEVKIPLVYVSNCRSHSADGKTYPTA